MKDYRSAVRPVFNHIIVKHMIAPECLSKTGSIWTRKMLLPVEPQCAGVIHTDFEKGFIRAEVIKYDDYIKYGSEAAVKEAGKLGVEGKEYVVQDGDIMHFRFNV